MLVWFNKDFYDKIIKPIEKRYDDNQNSNNYYNFDIINWFNP